MEVKLGERPFRVVWSLADPEARGPVDPNIYLFEYLRSSKGTASNELVEFDEQDP